MSKQLKEKKPRLGDINKAPENKKIYANDALLPETKNLLYKTKQVMLQKKLEESMDIYIMMTENGNKIKIKDEDDLTNLLT